MKYDGIMDKECIEICDVLNSLPGVRTFESCCGHLKDRFSVWFFCENINTISRLGRATERNYSDGKWEIVVDSTDTHPIGVFWLRSKVVFLSNTEMENSLRSLIDNILYWTSHFDEYFGESAPQGLDEAAEEYWPDFSNDFASKAAVESIRDAFKAGAKWMAEQGVSVERTVDDFGDGAPVKPVTEMEKYHLNIHPDLSLEDAEKNEGTITKNLRNMNTCKVPNKIYVTPGQIFDDELNVYNYDDCVTYIRKDALLEWAKETYLHENASAIRKVCFKQFIEKLESL